MKRIKQIEDIDCGVACVAMILQRYAGIPQDSSYKKAREALFGGGKTKLTKTNDLRRALKTYKIGLEGEKLRRFSNKVPYLESLGSDAIVATDNVAGSWHWMIWDAKKNKLLDPDNKKADVSKVTRFVRVTKL